jgi:hypothetical protein
MKDEYPNLAAIILLFILTHAFALVNAQTTGDYRSVAAGDWSMISIWQRYNGTAWVAATTYPANGPAAPVANTVTIQNTGTVVLNISPTTGKIGTLIIDNGATLLDLNIALNYTLNATFEVIVNGTINLTNTSVVNSTLSTPRLTIGSYCVLSAYNTTTSIWARNSGVATIRRSIQGAATWENLAGSYLFFEGSVINANLNASAVGNTVNYTSYN